MENKLKNHKFNNFNEKQKSESYQKDVLLEFNSEVVKNLKSLIDYRQYEGINEILDSNQLSQSILNMLLCYSLQNYRSNCDMEDIIRLLILNGADQNSIFHYTNKNSNNSQNHKFLFEKDNISILMYACYFFADIRLIELLCSEQNINYKDKQGKNALFYIIENGGIDGADNSDVVQFLLEKGIDYNCCAKIELSNGIFKTFNPLALSIYYGKEQTFQKLLQLNSDCNFKILPEGDTLLHLAVKKNKIEIIKILLQYKKFTLVEEKNKEGKTPQELALEIDDKENIIYNLIIDKIGEDNKEGDKFAEELIKEQEKNIKKNNKIDMFNILNIPKDGEYKINRFYYEIYKTKKTSELIKTKECEKTIKGNKEKSMDLKTLMKNHLKKKKKIINSYQKITEKNNITLKINYPNNDPYLFSYNKLKINNKSPPEININLFSKKFMDFSKNQVEMETMKDYKDEINNLNKTISKLKEQIDKLTQENTKNKNIINDLNSKNQELLEKCNNFEKINKRIPYKLIKENKEMYQNYLTKKFVNFSYEKNYIFHQLTQDILDFQNFITDRVNADKNTYETLINNVKIAAGEVLPDYDVTLYGSHATNLCLPWSDLDLVLVKKVGFDTKENILFLLQKLFEMINKQPWVRDCKLISTASMPIIKIITTERYNKMSIDLSFQEPKHFGLKCVDLVKQFMGKYESLKPLVLCLKNILKRANLNDPYKGGISSYGLILLIVYFLQKQQEIGLDISLSENNLGRLFHEFIMYYGTTFDSSKYMVIIKKEDNTENITNNIMNMQPFELIIVDPLNPNNNVAKSCFQYFNIKLTFMLCIMSLQEDCECGCHYLEQGENYSNISIDHCFLKRIFNSVKRFNT